MFPVRFGLGALAVATFAVALSPALAPGASAGSLGAAAAASAQLSAVSCTSGTQCFAVGSIAPGGHGTNSQPLIESFNGTAWSISAAAVPDATTSTLSGISCVAATSCMAVGSQTTAASAPFQVPLAEQWNGTAWSVVPTPVPPRAATGELNAVSCTTASFCLAVGDHRLRTVGGELAFAERWNGTAWTEMSVGHPAHSVTKLQGVSCRTASDCAAVGFSGDRREQNLFEPTLAEHFNGTGWAIVASPNAVQGWPNDLIGVSCSPGTNCMAVGDFLPPPGGAEHNLAAQFDGTAWSRVTIAAPAGASSPSLTAVSCPAASQCAAVGGTGTKTGKLVPEAASWNGTKWSVIIAPSPGPEALLAGVSCPGATVCVAVGQSTGASGNTHTLAEVRQGGSWKIVTTPAP